MKFPTPVGILKGEAQMCLPIWIVPPPSLKTAWAVDLQPETAVTVKMHGTLDIC